MKVIHVLRKPLSEKTVASNTIKHGTGGLNIDACRIRTADNLNGGPIGRWPANVILQHLDGCVKVGLREVSRDLRDATGEGALVQTNEHKGGGQWKSSGRSLGRTVELVGDWICEPGCPVARLDSQSGDADEGVSRFYLQVGGDEKP